MDLRNLINNLPTKSAFPSPGMPAVIKEFFEDHITATPRTTHRALTIHMNLLDRWIGSIQTNPCHDFMTGILNFYEGERRPIQGLF